MSEQSPDPIREGDQPTATGAVPGAEQPTAARPEAPVSHPPETAAGAKDAPEDDPTDNTGARPRYAGTDRAEAR